MDDTENLLGASDIEVMIIPSVKTIQATYHALQSSIEQIASDSKAVLDTLKAVDDVSSMLTGSTSFSEMRRTSGLLALPIPIAMRSLVGIASRLIKQRTGISFDDWASLVASARAQFEAYLAQLAQVAALSPKYDALASTTTAMDPAQLVADEELIRETQSKTRLLKPTMGKLAQLNQVTDALLESTARVEQGTDEAGAKSGKPAVLTGSLQRLQELMPKTIMDKPMSEPGRLFDWLRSPLDQLQNQTKQMSRQISQLSRSLLQLEDLLDLEIAQIQNCAGKIPPEQVEVLGQRVAAMILVPQLKDDLDQAKRQFAGYQAYMQKLTTAYQAAQIGEKVYQALLQEYQRGLEIATTRLAGLEAQVKAWKTKGPPLLDTGLAWLRDEIEIVKARKLVDQLSSAEADQTVVALSREIEQLETANHLLSSL